MNEGEEGAENGLQRTMSDTGLERVRGPKGRYIKNPLLAARDAEAFRLRGILVRHTCDNPPCCNLDHLLLGTKADNNRDTRDRGRHVPGGGRGSRNQNVKLTEEAVRLIRGCRTSNKQLAERYSVSATTIYAVRRRLTWDWVE